MDTCIETWQPTGLVGSRGGSKQAGLKASQKKVQTLLQNKLANVEAKAFVDLLDNTLLEIEMQTLG